MASDTSFLHEAAGRYTLPSHARNRERERAMKGDKAERGTWSRRDVVRVGSMATAAGVMGGIAVTDAAAASQARASQLLPPPKGPQIYTRIGVRPFINPTGT